MLCLIETLSVGHSLWKASVLLRQYTISQADVAEADEKLLEFCKLFEILYGNEYCTPNMHLHAHVKDCILDFGPISAFWAFPFERFNGILESFSKNWVKPEDQIMKKLISFQELRTIRTCEYTTGIIERGCGREIRSHPSSIIPRTIRA